MRLGCSALAASYRGRQRQPRGACAVFILGPPLRLGVRISAFLFLLLMTGAALQSGGAEYYVRQNGWAETMLASRSALLSAGASVTNQEEAATRIWFEIKNDFPVQWDWMQQDGPADCIRWFQSADQTIVERHLIEKALVEASDADHVLNGELEQLAGTNVASNDRRWLDLYFRTCERRRQQRLRTVLAKAPRIVFTKHHTIRPSFFAYTEGQSDAQDERHFRPGSELCVLEMEGLYGTVRPLLSDPTGAIRDPAVSWDGRRILFAWKKSLNEDDYHLYELEVSSNRVRQITFGPGFADYEPAYLPNDDIVFASTRCVQTVDCWWTEVSNLYTCDRNGRYLRRLSFDQVHAIYPQVLEDGRVIYTRWDYNDRGQIFTQALFQMNPDGTGQTEFYGNNSWFPTTMAHARGIPGTQKVMAILCGHHTAQAGKLAVIDPALGHQENSGVQLVAPYRDTPAERTDGYGQSGELWQYPWPLNERECLATYAPLGWDQPERCQGDADFGIYWMDMDGRRELLASDSRLPCNQPAPLVARPRPLLWANRVDYHQATGTYYVQDIYAGAGLEGVPRGTIKKLRVVALQFRAAGVGHNLNRGPAGDALVCTPVSVGNGSWDVKVVLGETKVHQDGSALFTVPAHTPLYFQALDERGCAVQTMRSWSTLQPGEYLSCVGCHEHKNTAPPAQADGFSLAMKAGVAPLEPFYGPARGFSFAREIQPILDQHCTRCHNDRTSIRQLAQGITSQPVLGASKAGRLAPGASDVEPAFSLLGDVTTDLTAKRNWSDAYLALTQSRPDHEIPSAQGFQGDCQGRFVHWISAQSVPEGLPAYSAGAARSELMNLLERRHKDVLLSREELEKIACWIDLLVPYCGDYREASAWTAAELSKYERFAEKRRRSEELDQENIGELLGSPALARRTYRSMFPGQIRANPQRARPSLQGQELPDLRAVGIPDTVSLGEGPVLVCLFDSSQRPSRHALAVLATLAVQPESIRRRRLTIIAVHAPGITPEALREWKSAQPVPFPVGLVADKTIATKWAAQVDALPWLILADAQHEVRAEGFSVDELEARMDALGL